MITAKEARFKSDNQILINDIIENLEREVETSIGHGNTRASVSISLDTNKEVKKYIDKYLTGLGYQVTISNHTEDNAKMGGHAIDQGYYYDEIEISW